MSESKHTPGPWSVTDNSWEVSSIYDANGGLVAECPIYDAVDEDTQAKYEPIKEANARLIAAAPDLLAALRDMRDACIAQGINFGPLIADAEVAIARAEGRDNGKT